MTRPQALPLPVPFPVYGLIDATGPRHLVQWNQPDYLWTVGLGYGPTGPGEWFVVETLRKAPRPQQPAEKFSTSPIRLDSAALHGITNAIERPTGKKARARADELLRHEMKLIEINDDDDTVVLHDWDQTTIRINGQPQPAYIRHIDSRIVVAVDLPDVVVAVTAPDTTQPSELDLRDIRDHLADYPRPSIRERMGSRRDPPDPPRQNDLAPLHVYLSDILANAQDEDTDPRELLARIEHICDHLLHTALPRLDRSLIPHKSGN